MPGSDRTGSVASQQPLSPPQAGSSRRTLLIGALAGVIATLLFMALHAVLILAIWEMAIPMGVSGALCGSSIAWSYNRAVETPSMANWITMNGLYVATLVALGIVSLLWFEPTWTFAELSVEGAPLGDLFSRAVPLMVAFAFAGSLPVWGVFSLKLSALGPILVTQTLLVLLLGHNVAIIGLVDFSNGGWGTVGEMLGFVALIGAAFTVTFLAIDRLSNV